MFVYGGYDSGTNVQYNDLHKLCVDSYPIVGTSDTFTWTALTPYGTGPSAKYGLTTSTLCATRLVFFGGAGSFSSLLYQDAYVLDTQLSSWYPVNITGETKLSLYLIMH
jgi:hypothetical protein